MQTAMREMMFVAWNYESNIKDATKVPYQKAQKALSKLKKKLGKAAKKFDLDQIQDYDIKRKLKLMRNIGTSALPDSKLTQFVELTTAMGEIYRLIHPNFHL